MDWRERDGARWLEAELPGARAAFTTRAGGVSRGRFAGLNLGLRTGDDEAAVRANRRAVAAALDLDPGGVLIGRQVHGARVIAREAAPRPNPYLAPLVAPEADGHATGASGLAPMVLAADCLPIALSGSAGVAMIHCGWRGLAAGIVARGVSAVSATAAAIGPGIGPCCYEVGAEVTAALAGLDGAPSGRGRLDLVAVASALLERAGVGAVASAGICVSCEDELFFSHRRDGGATGRQAGFAWADDG